MILVDANLLLYAYNAEAPQHRKASSWLEERFDASEPIGLPWTSLWAFLRVATNARIWPRAATVEACFERVRSWLEQPGVVIIHPGPRHAEILERLIVEHRAVGSLVSDAALAALAIENGATLASTDQDFSRFTGLRWVNPLRS